MAEVHAEVRSIESEGIQNYLDGFLAGGGGADSSAPLVQTTGVAGRELSPQVIGAVSAVLLQFADGGGQGDLGVEIAGQGAHRLALLIAGVVPAPHLVGMVWIATAGGMQQEDEALVGDTGSVDGGVGDVDSLTTGPQGLECR